MRTRLLVDGMRAVHAVRAVHTALTPVPGIVRADVTMGEVLLEHDGRATCALLRDAIGAAGYTVTHCAEDSRALPTIE